eukprot:6486469-Amphidinium_carterae.1
MSWGIERHETALGNNVGHVVQADNMGELVTNLLSHFGDTARNQLSMRSTLLNQAELACNTTFCIANCGALLGSKRQK